MAKRQVTGRFFRVFFNQGRNCHYAVVDAPEELDVLDIPDSEYIENWEPISFTKRKEDGELADFLSTDITKKLCSPKLKQVIDQNLTSKDMPVQWLPVTITKEENGDTFSYFYPHFPEICDSLDEEETTFSPRGTVMRPCFSLTKIKDRSICNCRRSSTLIMSKDLRKAIMEAECTGLKFEQTIVLEEYEEGTPSSNKIVNL